MAARIDAEGAAQRGWMSALIEAYSELKASGNPELSATADKLAELHDALGDSAPGAVTPDFRRGFESACETFKVRSDVYKVNNRNRHWNAHRIVNDMRQMHAMSPLNHYRVIWKVGRHNPDRWYCDALDAASALRMWQVSGATGEVLGVARCELLPAMTERRDFVDSLMPGTLVWFEDLSTTAAGYARIDAVDAARTVAWVQQVDAGPDGKTFEVPIDLLRPASLHLSPDEYRLQPPEEIVSSKAFAAIGDGDDPDDGSDPEEAQPEGPGA